MAKINGELIVSGTTTLNALNVSGIANFQSAVIVPVPTANNQATNKSYVDQLVSAGLNTKLNTSGGSLSGFLTLHASPTSDFHAASKQYVDMQVAAGGGSAGSYIFTQGTAGETIQGDRIVKIGPDGRVYKASNLNIGDAFSVIGISITSAVENQTIDIATSGIIEEPSWNYVAGGQAFLGIDGLITQTPPSSPATFQLSVGHFTFINSLYFSVGTPIFLEG